MSWASVWQLLASCPQLAELRLSNNGLGSPGPGLATHTGLQELFLSGNPVTCFHSVIQHIITHCPK